MLKDYRYVGFNIFEVGELKANLTSLGVKEYIEYNLLEKGLGLKLYEIGTSANKFGKGITTSYDIYIYEDENDVVRYVDPLGQMYVLNKESENIYNNKKLSCKFYKKEESYEVKKGTINSG